MQDLISRQDAINALIEWVTKLFDDRSVVDVINEVPSAQPEQRWIPVSERQPDKDGDYLVTFKMLFLRPVEVCTFADGQWNKFGYEKVLAWQPLPSPYTQE